MIPGMIDPSAEIVADEQKLASIFSSLETPKNSQLYQTIKLKHFAGLNLRYFSCYHFYGLFPLVLFLYVLCRVYTWWWGSISLFSDMK